MRDALRAKGRRVARMAPQSHTVRELLSSRQAVRQRKPVCAPEAETLNRIKSSTTTTNKLARSIDPFHGVLAREARDPRRIRRCCGRRGRRGSRPRRPAAANRPRARRAPPPPVRGLIPVLGIHGGPRRPAPADRARGSQPPPGRGLVPLSGMLGRRRRPAAADRARGPSRPGRGLLPRLRRLHGAQRHRAEPIRQSRALIRGVVYVQHRRGNGDSHARRRWRREGSGSNGEVSQGLLLVRIDRCL
uniref:Uncharacterized protein n=1 Tax=Setaria viridis TaxID=4556 RepID=A0A4U6V881_SETVI|nr:hypothetical protein SEVIR_4G277202v2 [Setaria viridis]